MNQRRGLVDGGLDGGIDGAFERGVDSEGKLFA